MNAEPSRPAIQGTLRGVGVSAADDLMCNERGVPESECPSHCHHDTMRREWHESGDGHGYAYQYIGPIHYPCECGDYFLNRERWLAHKSARADAATRA